METWKEEARRLYLIEKLKIGEVAEKVNRSRKSVSTYLNTLCCIQEAKEQRKKANAKKRVEYKREWDRANRNSIQMNVTGDTLKREHELAVMELSRERYYG